jgi:nucleoside-diphosphate-sugar epimerase
MQATIPLLIESGWDVTGVDNQSRHGSIDRARQYRFHSEDLTLPDVARRLSAGQDMILQAAATIYGVGGFHKWPGTILANDLTLHANMLRAAVAEGVSKFVYISSSMVYERCTHAPSTEDDSCLTERLPSTDYGLSKLVGERLCRAFSQEFGLRYTVWRPFNILTPLEEASDEQGISHVFADFKRRIVDERKSELSLIGDGEQVRCFTWIDDIASAIAAFSYDHRTDDESFNLGNPRPVTMRELATMMFERAKACGLFGTGDTLTFSTGPTYADDVRFRMPAIDRARQVLGWAPRVSLEEALDTCFARWTGRE